MPVRDEVLSVGSMAVDLPTEGRRNGHWAWEEPWVRAMAYSGKWTRGKSKGDNKDSSGFVRASGVAKVECGA